jgi:hypothetical protein
MNDFLAPIKLEEKILILRATCRCIYKVQQDHLSTSRSDPHLQDVPRPLEPPHSLPRGYPVAYIFSGCHIPRINQIRVVKVVMTCYDQDQP